MSRKRVKNMSRNQQKAVFYNMSQIKTRQKTRSSHAQAVDRGITAKHVYTGKDRSGKAIWMKHPNQVDIKNIDNKIAREQYKAKGTKRQLKQEIQKKSKIKKSIIKKKQRIKREDKPEIKQKLQKEIQQREQEQKKTELDIKNIEIVHRKTKRSIHEKQEEKHEVMYIMDRTENNNYVESKNLLDKVETKGLAYDDVDWDELQGSDLTYDERVRRLDKQIGHTYTGDEVRHMEERYEMMHEDYLESQRRGW